MGATQREATPAGPRIADSYIRMSTKGQLGGDSLRRQQAAMKEGERWAKMNGYAWNGHMRVDTASAYKKVHLQKGVLGEYLEDARAGKLKGHALVIETLDRLSRASVLESIGLLKEIVDAGITLVVLEGGRAECARVYSGEVDDRDLILALMSFSRAHDESKWKSIRLKEVSAAKRKAIVEGRKVACFAPPKWLRWNKESKDWRALDEHVETIKLVFNLYTRESKPLSPTEIVAELTRLGRPVLGQQQDFTNDEGTVIVAKKRHWWREQIRYILTNRALLGEKTVDGHVVRDYYPQIIENETFQKAQLRLVRRHNIGGTRIKVTSVLPTAMVRCSHCGGTISKHHSNHGRAMTLCCNRGVQAQCEVRCASTKHERFANEILFILAVARQIGVAGKNGPLDAAKAALDAAEGKVLDLEKILQNLTKAIETASDSSALDMIMGRFKIKSSELDAARRAVETAQYRVAELQQTVGVDLKERMRYIGQLRQKLETAEGEEKEATCREVQDVLRTTVDKIVVDLTPEDADCTGVIHLKTGQTIEFKLR